jgi:Ca2+-binding EF-hand superfamily protein
MVHLEFATNFEDVKREREDFFQRFDANHDGFLDKAEYRELSNSEGPMDEDAINENFLEEDENNDGKISQLEWMRNIDEYVSDYMESADPQYTLIGSSYDVRNAGGISEQDIRSHRVEFDAMDMNQDGQLTLEELERGIESHNMDDAFDQISAMDLLAALDHNNDGKVSFEEFVSPAAEVEEDATEVVAPVNEELRKPVDWRQLVLIGLIGLLAGAAAVVFARR